MLSDPDAELSDSRKTGRPMGGKPDRCCLSEPSVGRKIVVANDWPSPATVDQIYGTWATALLDAFSEWGAP
jgi:hypothetical protein